MPPFPSVANCNSLSSVVYGSVYRRKQERLKQQQQQQQQQNNNNVKTAPGATTPPSSGNQQHHNTNSNGHHNKTTAAAAHSDASSVASSSRSSRSPWGARDPAADARPIADPKLRRALGGAGVTRNARVNPRVSARRHFGFVGFFFLAFCVTHACVYLFYVGRVHVMYVYVLSRCTCMCRVNSEPCRHLT